MNAVVGAEEQLAVHVRQENRIRAARARADVLDEEGAVSGAVALPEFKPVGAVVGSEEQRPVYIRQENRIA